MHVAETQTCSLSPGQSGLKAREDGGGLTLGRSCGEPLELARCGASLCRSLSSPETHSFLHLTCFSSYFMCCCSPDEDALCCLQRAAWLNSNSVRHRGRLSATAASEEAEREEPQPCLALQLVRKLCLACLSLASGIIKTSDLFFNSLFSEKGKAALMEAFKSGAGFPCFVRQRGFL